MSEWDCSEQCQSECRDCEPVWPLATEDDDDEYLPEHGIRSDDQRRCPLFQTPSPMFLLVEVGQQDQDEKPKIIVCYRFEYHAVDSSLRFRKNQGVVAPLSLMKYS